MRFEVGDAVVHPTRGTGIVTGVEELLRHGNTKQYYTIQLLGSEHTSLMIAVQKADQEGLRLPIRLDLLEQVLSRAPETLPADYRARYQLLKPKLEEGDILQVAEAVRDLAWRRHHRDLTRRDERLYDQGMRLLASEVAGIEGIGMEEAEGQIRARLAETVAAQTTQEAEEDEEDEPDDDSSLRGCLASGIRKGVATWARIASGGRKRWPDTNTGKS